MKKNLIFLLFLSLLVHSTLYGQARADSLSHKQDSSREQLTNPVSNTINDTIDCAALVVARNYEKKDEFDKALATYQEALKCVRLENKREAFQGINRMQKRVDAITTKGLNKLKKYGNTLLDIVIYFLLILLLFFLLKFIFWLIRKSYNSNKIHIDIVPMSISSSLLSENFMSQRFKASINSILAEFENYSTLKKKVHNFEYESSKPVIRTKELSSLLEITMTFATPKLISLIPVIYKFLSPPAYVVSGFANFISEFVIELKVTVSGKGIKSKTWEILVTRTDLINELHKLSYEAVVFMKGNKK